GRVTLTTGAFCLCSGMVVGQGIQLTLVPTNYNGYHVSCSGVSDGSIDLGVTGGTPPYTYAWSTGATTQDVSGLRAGYVSVQVRDAANGDARGELTLTEPPGLSVDAVPYMYSNGHHISCHSCYNGNIQVTVAGGVAPYSYSWLDGPVTEDRIWLDAGTYQVDVSDANGCMKKSESMTLTQPERSDWTMSGNAGTYPGTHYIGTSDNKDVVFKSNGQERLRLMAAGELKIPALASENGYGLLMADSMGTVKSFSELADAHKFGCPDMQAFPWTRCGNQVGNDQVLGTLNEQALRIITHGVRRMVIDPDGRVLVGNAVPGTSTDYKLYVEGGIVSRDVKVTAQNFPDFVFAPEYALMPLAGLRRYLAQHRHLPGIPSAAEVEQAGGFEVGDLQTRLLKVVEEQALYILQLEERVTALEQINPKK
ncbi:MAG TPA: SprB repeat-containing protein, partial [Flavobacteriales bacterium]|nr:SprB repeat-containing protein [Flavobacteriales bacterium]